MKLLLILAIFLSTTVYSQDWVKYPVDSTFTILLPDNYQMIDTLHQKHVIAEVENGIIIMSIIPNEGASAMTISTEEELIEAYKKFPKDVIHTAKGQLASSHIYDEKGLKILRFSYRMSQEEEKYLLHCVTAFINQTVYAVQFKELESMTTQVALVREEVFSSIQFAPNLTIKNQMLTPVEGTLFYRIGYHLGNVLAAGLLIGVIVLISMLLARRKKKNREGNQP